MYEYTKDGKVVIKSSGSKNENYTVITIEVLGVPFMAGWSEPRNIIALECVVEELMHYFGSLSADMYTEIVRAYKYAIDEVK